jgi:4-carboxymuconolactone decarboxylase
MQLDPPLSVWLNSPGLADRAQALGVFCRFRTTLEPRHSELAILITGAHWRAGFGWAVHSPIAIKVGLDAAIVDAVRKGHVPVFNRDDDICVYQLAIELLENRKVLSETYKRAEKVLGTQAVVELVGVLGYYSLICMTIIAFEIPLPNDEPNPFC